MERNNEKMDNPMKTLDEQEIRRWWSVFKQPEELFEVRLLGDKTYTGYFDDVEQMLRCLKPIDESELYQTYFTINPVNPACSSRNQYGKFLFQKGGATTKNDILKRRWLPVDIDVERPSGISSTDEEKEYAHNKAGDVYRFLRLSGFPTPVVCDSSSGYHIYYPVDMDNSQDSEQLVKSFFDVLAARFTDGRIKIDKSVGDANRIMRMPGTWGRKGRDSSERPHRMSKILTVPDIGYRLTANDLRGFISKFSVKEEREYRTQYNGEQFDLREFIRTYGLKVEREIPYGNNGTKFVLEECPFDSSHKSPDSALFLMPSGAVGFKCFHDSCSGHDWHELRKMLDPTAYSGKPSGYQQWRPQNQPQNIPVSAPQTVETEQKGNKWLKLSSIGKLDLSNIECIDTGFRQLDKELNGLILSEVTVLSGSNSSGKSSWLNTLVLNVTQAGYKSAIWSGELPPEVLKAWIQMPAAGPSYVRPSKYREGRYYVPDEIGYAIDQWLDDKVYLYNNEYGTKWEQIFQDMGEMVSLGVKLFILDNLMALDIDILNGDKYEKQKQLVLQIVNFAKKNKAHIILVAHPRKSKAFLRKDDISGTADITNAVDNVLIIHRNNNDFQKLSNEYFGEAKMCDLKSFGNIIEIAKGRMFGAQDVMIGLNYDIPSRLFHDGNIISYGWETDEIKLKYKHTTFRNDNHQTFSPMNVNIQVPESREITGGTDMPFSPAGNEELPF